MQKYVFFLILLLQSGLFSLAQEKENHRYGIIKNGLDFPIGDIMTIKPVVWDSLCGIAEHPAIDSLLTPKTRDSLLAEINRISKAYPKDTLLSPDIFFIFKPYFTWLQFIDPHYRVKPTYVLSSYDYKTDEQYRKELRRKVRYLPFNLLNINDTLLVNLSLDPLFKKGDMVLSVNGVPASTILEYNYSDRLTSPTALLSNYFQQWITDNYSVEIMRDGERSVVNTSGRKSYNSIRVEILQAEATEKRSKKIDGVGYISVPMFFSDNSRLIKIIARTIRSFQKQGVRHVILDLRNNPGGHGDRFDELLSLFIDKRSVPYLRSAKVKLTQKNVASYQQSPENIGRLHSLSGKDLISEVPLFPEKYIPGMKYYVLMNEGTGSIAASFCNIMQYNDAAVLLGEPLLHNALKYGEVQPYPDRYPNPSIPALFKESGVSSVEFDEYTKAKDGILYPDYLIRCSASEYMSGKDPVLEKAIEYAKRER